LTRKGAKTQCFEKEKGYSNWENVSGRRTNIKKRSKNSQELRRRTWKKKKGRGQSFSKTSRSETAVEQRGPEKKVLGRDQEPGRGKGWQSVNGGGGRNSTGRRFSGRGPTKWGTWIKNRSWRWTKCWNPKRGEFEREGTKRCEENAKKCVGNLGGKARTVQIFQGRKEGGERETPRETHQREVGSPLTFEQKTV